jgi:hypothetical protein
VRELVIVLSDLYLSAEAQHGELHDVSFPALEHICRFAARARLPEGWQYWLSQRMGHRPQPIATVAAFGSLAAADSPATVWMATPVHLVAGMSSVHLDRRSVLLLGSAELRALAQDFGAVFADSGFALHPLESGEFLLHGPPAEAANASTPVIEPARAMGETLTAGMHTGGGQPVMRRLGAEIEMWLHDHPVNRERSIHGELPVTALWAWGPGPAPAVSTPTVSSATADLAFGSDAFLAGLWAVHGGRPALAPGDLTPVFGYPQAPRAVLELQICRMLNQNPRWSFFDALAHCDSTFLAPAIAALRAAKLERLIVVANDFELTLRASDRLRFWRRKRAGLTGLQ